MALRPCSLMPCVTGAFGECAQHGMSGLAYRPVCLVAATQAHLAGNSAYSVPHAHLCMAWLVDEAQLVVGDI